MNYLVIAPQLGFEPDGSLLPGGLFQFSRCLARALASCTDSTLLGIWSQVDPRECAPHVEAMVAPFASSNTDLNVRLFGGSRAHLAAALMNEAIRSRFDRVMYVLVNQAVLGVLPMHLPYDAWLIGREIFGPVSPVKLRVLKGAQRLLSISSHTAEMAQRLIPDVDPIVIHLCTEPEYRSGPSEYGDVPSFDASTREKAVLIVANMFTGMLYKGHQHLLWAWPEVVAACPDAQLWVAGEGAGLGEVMSSARALPAHVSRQIHFLGRLSPEELESRYRRCRVFAMPSSGEGFGLVYVEAARFGLPCIAGKYDAGKEVVLHGVTGLLVEQHPHDVAIACIRLLRDDRLATKLGLSARARYIDQFTFKSFEQRLHRALTTSVPSPA